MENFEFLKMIGKGSFGQVFLCKEKTTDNLYAMKIMKKEHIIRKGEVNHINAERRILKNVKHPFITVGP